MNTEPAKHRDSPDWYLLQVVKASAIQVVWEGRPIQYAPSPFIEISLRGQRIHTTATRSRTFTPVWDEGVKLTSSDPNSLLSISMRHRTMIPGITLSIGSTELKIQDLKKLAILNPDVTLDVLDMHNKTGSVVVRFAKYEPPVKGPDPPVVARPPPPAISEKMQRVGYQSQEISMDQVERIVSQILARAAPEDSDMSNV